MSVKNNKDIMSAQSAASMCVQRSVSGGKIHRAVKVAAKNNEITNAIKVASKCDIHGLEVQEIISLMEEKDFEERSKILLDSIGKYSIKHLAFHYPLKFPFKDFDDTLDVDLAGPRYRYIMDLTRDTIKEAGLTCVSLKLNKVFVVVHNLGFVVKDEVSLAVREEKMKRGESNLRKMADIASTYSKEFGCEIILVRENNPPDHGFPEGLLDNDPRDVLRTIYDGIGVNLDLAHLWMYNLYRKNGKREFPGVDLSNKIYPNFDLIDSIKNIAPYIRMLHLNDAGPGYTGKFEGIEIGTGNLPHKEIIETILKNTTNDIMGTYEIKRGHLDPETMYRSDRKYREIFGEQFCGYFD